MTKISLLRDMVVMPLQGTMDDFTGGLYDSSDNFLSQSVVPRGKYAPMGKPEKYIDQACIWGGCLFAHFGHLIWDSLTRFYAIANLKSTLPVLFITPNNKIFNYQKLIFKFLDLRNEIIIVRQPLGVKEIIYAEPGSMLTDDTMFIIPEQLQALGRLQSPQKNADKIWLSRQKLGNLQAKVANESYIEEELQKNGFKIVYPELLSIRQQTQIISSSAIVAGFDGSAWFSALFADRINSEIHVFNRNKKMIRTVPYVLGLKNASYSIHEFETQYVNGTWAGRNFTHLHPEKILETLL